jgi:hypothetical protein
MSIEKKLTAVEWLLEQLDVETVLTRRQLSDVINQAKVMEEQEKVEFAFRAYSEKLSPGKDFVEIVNSMRTFKQQEQ